MPGFDLVVARREGGEGEGPVLTRDIEELVLEDVNRSGHPAVDVATHRNPDLGSPERARALDAGHGLPEVESRVGGGGDPNVVQCSVAVADDERLAHAHGHRSRRIHAPGLIEERLGLRRRTRRGRVDDPHEDIRQAAARADADGPVHHDLVVLISAVGVGGHVDRRSGRRLPGEAHLPLGEQDAARNHRGLRRR